MTMAADTDWTPAPWEWAATRHDFLDGHAREATAVNHENSTAYSRRERAGFIALRVQLACEPEPQRCIPHSMRYV
jgi:hypothetical protein